MSKEFLKKLIEAFPNYMELGAAVWKYNALIEGGVSEKDVEEYILKDSFKIT